MQRASPGYERRRWFSSGLKPLRHHGLRPGGELLAASPRVEASGSSGWKMSRWVDPWQRFRGHFSGPYVTSASTPPFLPVPTIRDGTYHLITPSVRWPNGLLAPSTKRLASAARWEKGSPLRGPEVQLQTCGLTGLPSRLLHLSNRWSACCALKESATTRPLSPLPRTRTTWGTPSW